MAVKMVFLSISRRSNLCWAGLDILDRVDLQLDNKLIKIVEFLLNFLLYELNLTAVTFLGLLLPPTQAFILGFVGISPVLSEVCLLYL